MKTLNNVVACVIACALCSAAPTRGVEPKAIPPQEKSRDQAVKQYFAPAAPAPADGNSGDPKWVESMQRLLKEITEDNARLRNENKNLRADNQALKQYLEEYEAQVRRRQDNRGAGIIPPNAPPVPQGNGQVPPNWRPFEFNGATYYVVPLEHRTDTGQPASAPREPRPAITLPEATK